MSYLPFLYARKTTTRVLLLHNKTMRAFGICGKSLSFSTALNIRSAELHVTGEHKTDKKHSMTSGFIHPRSCSSAYIAMLTNTYWDENIHPIAARSDAGGAHVLLVESFPPFHHKAMQLRWCRIVITYTMTLNCKDEKFWLPQLQDPQLLKSNRSLCLLAGMRLHINWKSKYWSK